MGLRLAPGGPLNGVQGRKGQPLGGPTAHEPNTTVLLSVRAISGFTDAATVQVAGRTFPPPAPARVYGPHLWATPARHTKLPGDPGMFGADLRKARLAAGLTQEELAFRAGIDCSHVSDVERDQKSSTVAAHFMLRDAMGASPAKLIARVERSCEKPVGTARLRGSGRG